MTECYTARMMMAPRRPTKIGLRGVKNRLHERIVISENKLKLNKLDE